MKNFNEMSEAEILQLSDEQIQMIIKVKKAEKGVKLLSMPEEPRYETINKPELTVYKCESVFGNISFSDIKDIEALLEVVRKSKLSGTTDYEHRIADGNYKFLKEGFSRKYSSENWDSITSSRVYSEDEYSKIKDLIQVNQKLKNSYDKLLKNYRIHEAENAEIESSVWDTFYMVKAKHEKLQSYCRMMENEYLPIANNDEKIAIGFLVKAYGINEEEKIFILENYSKTKNKNTNERANT